LYGGNMVSVSLTWWELGLVVGGSAIFVPIALIALGIGISVINDHRRQRRRQRERHRRPQLAIPYYVDESGVYDLARSLKIDLAIGREVTRQGKFAVSFQGFGGEGARSEMKRFAAGLDLNYLAERARETLDDDRLADGLGVAPEVRDEEVLAETADRLATRLGETSRTREILQELQSAYEQEKQETIAEDKRRELRTAAAASKLVLLRGQFTAAADRGVAAIRLTHFEAPSVRSYVPWELLEYSSAEDAARWEAHRLARETQAGDDFEDVASQIPIPAGVEIQVVFQTTRCSGQPDVSGLDEVTRSTAACWHIALASTQILGRSHAPHTRSGARQLLHARALAGPVARFALDNQVPFSCVFKLPTMIRST
jgi:hypothetical protein